jgi:hypothetical protein
MSWPGPADYNGVIQNPKAAFRDPKLKDCAVELKPGKPWPWPRAGANAIVYRLYNGSWSTAVRVFMNEPRADRQARYQKVNAYLQQTRPRCMVEFGYEPDGIQVNGQWLPLLRMEWVAGKTLGVWFREAVERNDRPAIKQMAHEWIKLVCELRSLEIAHCDLQHGNVMVVDDKLVLVDYDGMFVPTMNTGDDRDRVAWENGLPAYQHPGRIGQLLSPAIDDFSAWIILISLRAVADDPTLWHRLIGQSEEESLLFTERDIKAPERSPLWPELIHNAKDRMVREWSAALRKSLDGPFHEIPPFTVDIFGPLREVLKAGDWRQIHELATSRRYASETFPPDLAPKVGEAIKRVEMAQQFEQAVRGGKLREIARAYRPELLEDWLDPAMVARGKQARAAVALIEEFGRVEASDPSGRPMVALWDRRGGELQGIVEGDAVRTKVESWRRRIAAAERLDLAIGKGAPERAIAEAWHVVESLGGHPDADRHRARADTAGRRLQALGAFAGVPAGEDEATDRALLKVWNAASTALDGCAEADPIRARVQSAKGRAARYMELKRRIDEADQGRGSEQAVLDAAQALPPGYGAGFVDRLRQARERLASSAALDQALAASPQSDMAIAAAAERARADGTWPARPEVAARCELAIRRRDRLRALDAIPASLPIDEQDAQWAAGWDHALLADCHDAREHRVRHTRAVERVAAFAELERALGRGDAVAVKRLARDPKLAGHPGVARQKGEIDTLIARSERVERLIAAARNGQADAFLGEAEPALLAAHAAAFAPYRDRIAEWVDRRLQQGDVLHPADPMFLPDPTGTAVTARWAWAQPRLVRTCLVATDTLRFLERPEEARQGTFNLDPETHRRGRGGTTCAVPIGCRKLFVTVWPVVDLGWDRRVGPPLRLGPYIVALAGQARVAARPSDPGPRPWSHRVRGWFEHLLNW